MAIDFLTATEEEISTELTKYSLKRRLLQYRLAEEEILSLGQENWDGDKKNYQARLDYIQSGIKDCEKALATSKSANGCPIKACNVEFV